MFVINRRLDGAQSRGERGLRVDEVEFGDGTGNQLDCGKLRAQFFRQSEEYARDLALFRFAQRLKLVVGLDGFERLDEDGRARRRRAVRDALDAPTVVAADGNDEALVPDRHKLVLNRLLRAAHQGFERARDGRAKAHDVRAYAREFGAGTVVQVAARKYLRRDARGEAHQRARQFRDRLPQQRRGLALRLHGGARVRRLLAPT